MTLTKSEAIALADVAYSSARGWSYRLKPKTMEKLRAKGLVETRHPGFVTSAKVLSKTHYWITEAGKRALAEHGGTDEN